MRCAQKAADLGGRLRRVTCAFHNGLTSLIHVIELTGPAQLRGRARRIADRIGRADKDDEIPMKIQLVTIGLLDSSK